MSTQDTKNTNTEREAFKDWHRQHGDNTQEFSWVDALLWKCWQARASLSLPAEGQEPVEFPEIIMALLREVSDRNGTETRGPWQDGNGNPMQDAADAAIAWICARAAPQPAVAAGWQRLITAPADEIVLVAAEFDRPGDWRIKCGYFDKQTTTWRVFGASWEPTHWMPLPPAPSTEGESNG